MDSTRIAMSPMHLTPHFTQAEMIYSETANLRGIDNTPPPEVVSNLVWTARGAETLRTILDNNAIIVTSGFRCDELNFAVGGAEDSYHPRGLAMDFICPGIGSPRIVWRVLKERIAARPDFAFDQIILERRGKSRVEWIHFASARDPQAPRREFLTLNAK